MRRRRRQRRTSCCCNASELVLSPPLLLSAQGERHTVPASAASASRKLRAGRGGVLRRCGAASCRHSPFMITVFASATARAFVLRHPHSTLARLSMQRIGQVSMQHVATGEAGRPASMVAMGETTSLNGTVRRVLFRADTGYTVATLDCSPEGQKAVVITSNHCLALVQPGERLAVVGRVCHAGLEPRTSRLRARPQPTRHSAPVHPD